MQELYDVAIIGAGITGSALAAALGAYNQKVVLLEKELEPSFGVSKANSGIVHGGFHYSAVDTLKGRLEIKGNQMYTQWHENMDFDFERCGILVVAFEEKQLPGLKKLYEQGIANNVPGIKLLSNDETLAMEPKLKGPIAGALYAPEGGVIEPYSVVFALVDTAKLNGVDFKTSFKVVSAKFNDQTWEITSANNQSIKAKYVVNAAGLFADEVSAIFGGEEFKISPRKGEEYLLDRKTSARPNHVIFPMPSEHSKGILVIPTAGGTTMIGPTAQITNDKEDNRTTQLNKEEIFRLTKDMVEGVNERDLITSFSGSRPVIEDKEDFFIAISEKAPNFIQAAGILSPGLTAAPAVAEYIIELLVKAKLTLTKKSTPVVYPAKVPKVRNLKAQEVAKLAEQDPAWANIVCRCEKVSEYEIRSAIRKGHITLDGVKLATRAGMGRCQSGFCALKLMHLIADETNVAMEEVIKRENASKVISGKLEDFRH